MNKAEYDLKDDAEIDEQFHHQRAPGRTNCLHCAVGDLNLSDDSLRDDLERAKSCPLGCASVLQRLLEVPEGRRNMIFGYTHHCKACQKYSCPAGRGVWFENGQEVFDQLDADDCYPCKCGGVLTPSAHNWREYRDEDNGPIAVLEGIGGSSAFNKISTGLREATDSYRKAGHKGD